MNHNLKPCPFCGGDAHITTLLGKKVIMYIECDGCRALMGYPRAITSALKGKLYFDNINELVNAWNNR